MCSLASTKYKNGWCLWFAPSQEDIPSKRRASLFGHVARLNPDVLAHQAPRMQTVGCRTSDGDGHLVDHERPGAPRSGLTSECHLVTTGTPISTVATMEWRNGPQGFRDDDDDDDECLWSKENLIKPCNTLNFAYEYHILYHMMTLTSSSKRNWSVWIMSFRAVTSCPYMAVWKCVKH